MAWSSAGADRPETPELAEPAAAQEVTFAEVLQEMQTHIPPTYPADELPHWAKLNIQNAPPVVTKLLGMKAM